MIQEVKKLAALLPPSCQQVLKKIYFPIKIRAGKFVSEEKEFQMLGRWVKHGDWVLDIGANVGTYTLRCSSLVGLKGRVFSFEPIQDTFELLTANASYARYKNITLFNVAASDKVDLASMDVPAAKDTGMSDFYRAQITKDGGKYSVLTLNTDALKFPHRIKLVKMDAEGHELQILKGMRNLIKRDKPIFIIEDDTEGVEEFLEKHGYSATRYPGSWNVVYTAN